MSAIFIINYRSTHLSAEMEENFKFLESLLVCLKYCIDEIKKNRSECVCNTVLIH